MNLFAVHVLLTLIWAGLLGAWDRATILSGFVLAYAVLRWIYRGQPAAGRYFRKYPLLVALVAYYLWELVRSNVKVAREILTLRHRMRPGMIAVPLAAETDLEITLLANLISMTPGSLALEIADDRRTLYVHAMYVDDAEAIRAAIRDKLERRVLAILRGPP